MRNRSSSASRRHQLLLSLSPRSLQILHFCRGWGGWKQVHAVRDPLPDENNFLQDVQSRLADCVTQWALPAGTRVHWVLAGDILGIAPPAPGAAENVPPPLPFSAADTRTQADMFKNAPRPSLMWVHKDWVTEIERISTTCGLELVELFARAQLFQQPSARQLAVPRAVVELDNGQYFLHIFSSGGTMLRTRVLESQEATESLAFTLKSELASLSLPTGAGLESRIQLVTSAGIVSSGAAWASEYQCSLLPDTPQEALLAQLWRSDKEGIVVRQTHDDLVQSIKMLSIAIGMVGLAGLATMIWHDGRLEAQIEDLRAQARKELPKVEAAKTLKSRTLRMADAVQAAAVTRENTQTMTAFMQVLGNFPPAPAALMYLRADNSHVEFVGSGDPSSLQWLKDRPLTGFEPWGDFVVPDFLASNQPAIHLQARKSPSAAPAPTTNQQPAPSASKAVAP